jgi:enamine deaminase RidA (YjgF/YER057c/UK114 family)
MRPLRSPYLRLASLLLPLAGSGCVVVADNQLHRDDAGKTIVIPAGQGRAYDDYHYAPAVRVGDTVIVSGIPAGGEGSYEDQIRRMFERARKTLEAADAKLADVVEINTFHAQPKDSAAFNAEFERFLKVHKEYFPEGYPAWTAVGTTALLAPGAVVEMRLVAVTGAGRSLRVQRQD